MTTLYFTYTEGQVLSALNQARSRPREFMAQLEKRRKNYNGRSYQEPGGVVFTTQEGLRAFDEAINFLRSQKPLPEFELSAGMTYAARDHVADMYSSHGRGHTGSDGSSSSKRIDRYATGWNACGENIGYGETEGFGFVAELIIDDGVGNRGHRVNIFNPAYKIIGLACGLHKKERSSCVITFADQYISAT
eukprot:TRINITY_DN1969_c0_g1_i1.p2 TRINITY_DN1969_c0_g1~~TRINITY_DN1969_c0_g1_i1.p2  ORF type:complete len:191 (-),score=47.00 TRINITY_DN1969_c0_g1_i1:333-905(-)